VPHTGAVGYNTAVSERLAERRERHLGRRAAEHLALRLDRCDCVLDPWDVGMHGHSVASETRPPTGHGVPTTFVDSSKHYRMAALREQGKTLMLMGADVARAAATRIGEHLVQDGHRYRTDCQRPKHC
jgi:hypothetical protein